jgi:epoxyqueuosine reductase
MGCLQCQWVCPENKDARHRIQEGPTFSQEETELLLAGTPLQEFPAGTLLKMQRVHLDLWVELLPRNLGALLRSET